jgi:hypothetical protein
MTKLYRDRGKGLVASKSFFKKTPLLAALSVAACCQASAQTAFYDSANEIMPGCREFIIAHNSRDAFAQGTCSGAVGAIITLDPEICPPAGARRVQSVRIVVQYIDARPAGHHEV